VTSRSTEVISRILRLYNGTRSN